MKYNLVFGLILALPIATFTACSDEDDTNGNMNKGGTSGSHTGGRGGNGGRTGNGGSAGYSEGDAGSAGEPSAGGTAGDAAGAGGADTAGEGGGAGAAAALNDAQILNVLSTANNGEVTAAQVAKPSLQNAAAVAYAQTMITDHTAANTQTLGLVSTKHLAPEPSDVSESLAADSAALLVKLSKTPAAAFDKTYIDSQVAMHQEVLSLIDTRLTPGATDADVKGLLVTTRASVATHLANAQTISASLP